MNGSLFVLCLEFFKTGLFAVGGGLATLPFLYQLADKYTWFTRADLADVIAIGESTPGPIGVNMATYAGFHAYGIGGGILATLSLVLPSLLVILLVARFLQSFQRNKLVQDAFYGIRPAVCGLISAAGLKVFQLAVLRWDGDVPGMDWTRLSDYKPMLLFVILLFCSMKWKKIHPILWIALAAACGAVFAF